MHAQPPFPLDDLRHVRLAARRAGNPFFDRTVVEAFYSRTVFAGLGLLFLARPVRSCPQLRVHLSFFAPVEDGSWLVLLPHHGAHGGPAEAQAAAEDLAAQMHRTSWHQAVGLFARPSSTGPEAAGTVRRMP
ncbi:hypothetical protein ABZ070_30115 [Streptomyces sp. NPDC006283]|uniref:hypothetical protein n=1 Tax=Streptomyces sp. NPDC006283 TaxID=3156741 RepID=UPI0033B13426